MTRNKLIIICLCLIFVIACSGCIEDIDRFMITPIENTLTDIIYDNSKSSIGTQTYTPTKTTTNTPTKSISEVESEIEKYIILYTNQERVNYGISSLKSDNKLSEIAKAHSKDMVNKNYYSHTNKEGLDVTGRGKKAGYNTVKNLGNGWTTDGLGENICDMPLGKIIINGNTVYLDKYDGQKIARAFLDAWMNSPGHKKNILDTQYNNIGVGVSYNYNDGYYYATQDFW